MTPSADTRTAERRASDEAIAAELPQPFLDLPPGAAPKPLEAHLPRKSRPVAVAGVVENGLVRLLDPAVRLPERARVIVVASEVS